MSSPNKESTDIRNLLISIQSFAVKWAPAFRGTILLLISVMSILIRVFSVIRYESVIHEFDPWFNFRATKYLAKEGLYGFWNWFDSESWYPLGRNIGGTIYPGLMSTSAIVYWVANYLSIPVDIRNVCVFLAPVFAALTSLSGYLLTKEVTGRTEAGLFSALFVAIVPSYISRSVAGSYDNEGVSIFALVFTFYVFLRAVNTGSLLWSGLASLAYFYMVSAWGGYAFIINIIPIFVVFQMIVGRMTTHLYVAYSVFYVLGTILAMQIPFVGFQAIRSSEHLASHGVFIFLQFFTVVGFVKKFISKSALKLLTQIFIYGILAAVIAGSIFLALTGKTKWSGRSMTLLDPTYAKKYIPIIASVSEHQATTWSSFFFDLHFLVILTPVGLYHCFKRPTDGKLFVAIYVVLSVYFASVMVRLLLVLAPAVSIVGGIGASVTIRVLTKSIRNFLIPPKPKFDENGKPKKRVNLPVEVSLICIIFISYLVSVYIFHANLAAGEAYASPSIIMSNKDKWGNKRIVDDYREAYYWLRQNTREDDKIMSWWDYGYQITGMANRTVLVDNNTWNNSHIATVGMAMASSEDDAFEICEKLDVDYVLVIFGGVAHYSSDDINKFLWMVRIGGGVFPHIKEEDYYGSRGSYRIDTYASETMLNSLMYKLSYYRFDEVVTGHGKKTGWDTVRQVEIGHKGFKLNYFEEAFTSEHWIVRIYRVKPRPNRSGITFRSPQLFKFPENMEDYKKSSPVFEDHKYGTKIENLKKRIEAQ